LTNPDRIGRHIGFSFRSGASCIIAVAGLFALAAILFAATKRAESKHADRDVSADTDPNSEFWSAAPAVFIENDRYGAPVPGFRTEVRSRWTSTNLYFLFICPYQELYLKPDPKTDAETNQLWKWDVAETFIGSNFDDIRRYKEFEISPRGEWVDLDINLNAQQNDWLWNSGFQTAGRIDAAGKRWYGFMRIPYASIDSRKAAAGNVLRINFFLSEGEQPNHKGMSWQPTGHPSFHVPEAFGMIELTR
jgi:hypothetical protein